MESYMVNGLLLRGEKNFGIKLVKVLPKIHKLTLDMFAKDIFRSENK